MKHFYISSKNQPTDVSRYAEEFYRLVLEERGYIFIDSAETIPSILSAVGSRDHVHIELGVSQKKEIEILFTMLRANYQNVSVTLHSPPLLKYPLYEFDNPVLNELSKMYDRYANQFQSTLPYIKKIKSIYVLTKKGEEAIKKTYKVENVFYLPHIIDTSQPIETADFGNNNFVYLGFIGRNKQVEYSLRLHQKLLTRFPEIKFYLIGTDYGVEHSFLTSLKENYKNVEFIGFIPDSDWRVMFEKSSYAIIMFEKYRFFWPSSGSVLQSLQQGKILFTNKVNAVPSIIENDRTGYFLSGRLQHDMDVITNVITNPELKQRIKNNVYDYLLRHHSKEEVSRSFKD